MTSLPMENNKIYLNSKSRRTPGGPLNNLLIANSHITRRRGKLNWGIKFTYHNTQNTLSDSLLPFFR